MDRQAGFGGDGDARRPKRPLDRESVEFKTARFALITGQPYESLLRLTPKDLHRLTAVWNDMQPKKPKGKK